MKKTLNILLVSLLVFHANRVMGQDPNYSQFFASPLTISPALAGKSDTKWQANSLYKNQSFGVGANFNTKILSVDGRIYDNDDNNNTSYIGLGALLMVDEAVGGLYKNSFVSLNSAYHITLDKYENHSHSLTAGLGFIYNKTNIDYANLTTSEQLGFYGFNRALPTGETALINIPGVASASAGLLYSYATDENVLDVGIAGYRFYKNKYSAFENGTQSMTPRYNVHVNYSKFINYKVLLFLKGYYQIQDGNSYVLGGGHLEYSLNEVYQDYQRAINLGVYYRWNNAIIPYFGFVYNQLQFALTYDIQTSQIKGSSINPNAFELSIIYKKQKKSWNPLL